MSVSTRHEATVYCDGGYHLPLTFFLYTSAPTKEISEKLRQFGWTKRPDGTTYCSLHKPKRGKS